MRIEKGMRLKDLPRDLRIAAEINEGALEPIRFRGGTFFFVKWKQNHPLWWPEAEEIEVFPGDYFIEMPDGGVVLVRNAINHYAELAGG